MIDLESLLEDVDLDNGATEPYSETPRPARWCRRVEPTNDWPSDPKYNGTPKEEAAWWDYRRNGEFYS